MAKVSEVFVAGGQPKITYVSRNEFKLEDQIREYLDSRYKILSISGPTKTGKTVLVRSMLSKASAFWLSGGQIQTASDFWNQVIEQDDGFTTVSHTEESTSSESDADSSGFKINAGIASFDSGSDKKNESSSKFTTSRTRSISDKVAALELLANSDRPLIIDDFHYISPELQLTIVRSLKDLVFDGLSVLFLSVPHRAFDAVRVEREMTGRVSQLEVPFWQPEELKLIGDQGFPVLNLEVDNSIVNRLVKEAFSSPHLMQDFCADLCRANNVQETTKQRTQIPVPSDWDAFFRKRASGTSKAAFDRLAIGPRQRTDRISRRLRNGKDCDIYVAVLLAIAQTGPLTQLRYEEIRNALRDILAESIPQANEITRVLEQMSRIAHDEIKGEPVVDWDRDYSTLHISDPFFAYYLRWGTDLPKQI